MFIWEIVPGTENIFKIGSPYNPVAVSGYRGDLYIASQYGDIFRMKNGQPPCVRMDTKIHLWNGDTLHNLVSLTNLKVLDGRLYSTGSTVAVLDTVSDQWMEIAPSWLSGPLPSGSPYSTYDRGCFSNGGGWDLAKVGDTLYFASNRGLWYVDLKTTLTCKLDYTKNDSCGKVARIQSCIPPEQYCCDYQHGTVDWCKYASCPNAAARRVGNPVSP